MMNTKKGNIVVVDDDREMRSMLQDFLISDGYEVATFPLATEALAALKANRPFADEHIERRQ